MSRKYWVFQHSLSSPQLLLRTRHLTNNLNPPLPLGKIRPKEIVKHQIFPRRLKDLQVFERTENGSDADVELEICQAGLGDQPLEFDDGSYA
jgi:hypothetical protein